MPVRCKPREARLLVAVFFLCRLSNAAGDGDDPPPNPLLVSANQYFNSKSWPEQARLALRDIWQDQKAIWTSPLHLKKADLPWIIPVLAVTGVLLATDSRTTSLIHSNPANRGRSSNISNAGVAALAAGALVSYGIGALTYNQHARETGKLTAEALANSLLVSEALKLAIQRSRPDGVDPGQFWQHPSLDSSFPSQHAAMAWAAAAVIAREYPGPLVQWSAYGLASLVSLSRITAGQHFPADVLAGAVAGYLIGRHVYNGHHDDSLTDRTGSTAAAGSGARLAAQSPPRRPSTAPIYVPLDSWVYPALKRLAALGYIPDQFSDIGPWTRIECSRQSEEAADFVEQNEARRDGPGVREEALRLIHDLKVEFGNDSRAGNAVRLESVYTGVTAIRGTPLNDSYHFGQTLWDNYDRPYGQGLSDDTGGSAYATYGRFSLYFRGEYQYAPGSAAASPSVLAFISSADGTPVQAGHAIADTSRFQPLDMYAGVQLGPENITFGKQSLWWGPGEDSAFAFSDNAAPFYMLRISQAKPLVLPGFLSHLGRIKTEIIFGKLSGHHYPARPYVQAQKITFDLTNNLEIGFTRSAFFGGVGHPLTFGSLAATLFSFNSQDYGPYGFRADLAGDRHSDFDFRWRVPGLTRYLTIYSDSYADDEPNPIDAPRRSAWGPGLYLSQLPGLRRMDFRFETYSTLLYRGDAGGNFLYWDGQYRDSYTNEGNLLGSWIGRDARAYSGTLSYWVSGRSRLEAQFRQIKTGGLFLPGGGTQTDATLTAQMSLSPEWLVTSQAQFERYFIPLLGGPRNNLTLSVELIFNPSKAVWRP
jgi:membrane-associated phospholipid phosphatase